MPTEKLGEMTQQHPWMWESPMMKTGQYHIESAGIGFFCFHQGEMFSTHYSTLGQAILACEDHHYYLNYGEVPYGIR